MAKKAKKKVSTIKKGNSPSSFPDLPLLPVFEKEERFIPENLLENNLEQEFESENSIRTVSKELFSHQHIDLKTEVSHDEINNVTRIKFLQQRFKIDNVDVLLDSFLRLRVSKERKSRREFIEALQTENRSAGSGGLVEGFKKLFGGGGQV